MSRSGAVIDISRIQKAFTAAPYAIRLGCCAIGIYLCYGAYAYAQEAVYKTELGGDGADSVHFSNTSFLLFLQSLASVIMATIVIFLTGDTKDDTPFFQYFPQAMFQLSAMWCSNSALSYIDYPTQVLAKACKPVAVMIAVFLAGTQKPSFARFLCVCMISAGISLFMFEKMGPRRGDEETSLFGLLLLFFSLSSDGIMGPLQGKLMKTYKPSAVNFMLRSNLCSVFILSLGFLWSGALLDGISFCFTYPKIIFYLAMLSFTSSVGQIFIYLTLHQFGSLTTSITTTSRKFFTLLFSVVRFGHVLSPLQWLSVVMVFIGLLSEGYYKGHTTKSSIIPVTPPARRNGKIKKIH